MVYTKNISTLKGLIMFWDVPQQSRCHIRLLDINHCPAKVISLNFHPLEVLSRYRESQHQEGAKITDIFLIWDQIFANPDV